MLSIYTLYSQSGTLYDLLPDALQPSTNLESSKPTQIPPIDYIIGLVAQNSRNISSTSTKPKSTLASAPSPPTNTPKNLSKTSEVNVVQSTTVNKASKGEKKDKGKDKSNTPKQDPPKPYANDRSKCKPKYPCLICDEYNYTKDCPCRVEVSRLLKVTQGTPTVLKEPFPSQKTSLVDQPQSSTYLGSQVFMGGTTHVSIAT